MIALIKQILQGREGQAIPCYAELHNLFSDGQVTSVTLKHDRLSARLFLITYGRNSTPRKRNYKNVPLERFSDEVLTDIARCIVENS